MAPQDKTVKKIKMKFQNKKENPKQVSNEINVKTQKFQLKIF